MNDLLEVPLLAEYGTYHRDPRNRICHEFGIPLIVLRLVGAKALTAIVVLVALYFLSWYVSWPLAIGLFVIGWVLQFVGHIYEGKRPAFTTNLVHLLIGPLWILAASMPRRSA